MSDVLFTDCLLKLFSAPSSSLLLRLHVVKGAVAACKKSNTDSQACSIFPLLTTRGRETRTELDWTGKKREKEKQTEPEASKSE